MTFSSLTRAGIVSLVIAGSTATFAVAQTPITRVAGMPSFAQEINGKSVWITADGVRREGRVTSLTTTSLVLVEDGSPITIPYQQIARVEKTSHAVRYGALFGLASGAGLGFWGIAALCSDEYCTAGDWIAFPAFYGGLGAVAGAGIGAIVKATTKHGNVIYDAQRNPKTIAVAPIVSKSRKGVAVSLSWR